MRQMARKTLNKSKTPQQKLEQDCECQDKLLLMPGKREIPTQTTYYRQSEDTEETLEITQPQTQSSASKSFLLQCPHHSQDTKSRISLETRQAVVDATYLTSQIEHLLLRLKQEMIEYAEIIDGLLGHLERKRKKK